MDKKILITPTYRKAMHSALDKMIDGWLTDAWNGKIMGTHVMQPLSTPEGIMNLIIVPTEFTTKVMDKYRNHKEK